MFKTQILFTLVITNIYIYNNIDTRKSDPLQNPKSGEMTTTEELIDVPHI